MEAPLLETRRVGKSFGGLRAVDAVDFAILPATITGIIGPNGAGKTTFFNLISRTLPVSDGHIFFDGHDVTALQAHEMARRGLARTFQATTVFSGTTALDNVLVGYRRRTTSGVWDALVRSRRQANEERAAAEAARVTLARVGLADVANRPARGLTQEQQKRLALAVALAAEPRLLLLDEPSAGISAAQTRGFIALVERLAADGITVCLIEHQMQVVMQLCQAIMVLDYGRKIAEGTPDQIRNDPAVLEAYLGG